jgi:lipoprotein-anchoring transpeptidase ErfK/SrfK
MSNAFFESRKAVEQAREALRRGDRAAALKWGQEAARLAPQSEDPWLILAAVASPRASVDYIKKALEANPESPRAHRGMQWAMRRLQESSAEAKALPGGPEATAPSRPAAKGSARKKRNLFFATVLFALGCAVVAFAAWSAVSNPALAAILSLAAPSQPAPTPHPQSWAQAELPKPTYTPTSSPPTLAPTATLPPPPSETPTPIATATPEPSLTPESIAAPGVMQAAIVPDTPTSEYAPPAADPALAEPPSSIAAAVYGERWIDVDLSQQRVYAYEGDTIMNSFIVSTGTWQTPTVTGTYKIWIKLRSTTMAGPGYYLPNVPYTMYFYKGYGLHGTYWHNNFGTPMSHGCVNLRVDDAAWLYNFASEGTTVNVHY